MDTLACTGNVRRVRNRTGTGPGRRRSRKRYSGPGEDGISLRDLYGRLVSTSLAVRRDRLSKWAKRVTAHVRQTRGWNLAKLLDEAKVTKSMYYRWVNGNWESDLEPSAIERFCDAAGAPVAEPLQILWPGKFGPREATPPLPMSPEFEAIMRKLNDPHTSKEDLYLIQATLDMLLSRVAPDAQRQRKA